MIVVYEEGGKTRRRRVEYGGVVLRLESRRGMLVKFDGYDGKDGECWVNEQEGDEWRLEAAEPAGVPAAKKRRR